MVGAVGAAHVVVALAAVERQRGQRADAVDGAEPVGAAEALHGEALDREVVDHRGVLAERRDRAAVGGDADRVVALGAARERAVRAVAAVDVDLAGPGDAGVADHGVGLAAGGDASVVLRLGRGHLDVDAGGVDAQLAGAVADVEAVRGVAAVGGDGVGLAVALARVAAEVDVGEPQAGAAEVADGDRVGAAERAHLRGLDRRDVHGDRADVAGQPRAVAVGGDVDLLARVGGVEVERVGAALALDGVAGVARIPLEAVVAAAELGRVGAEVAVGDVVAGAADQRLAERAAAQGVVAGPAVERDRRGGGAAGVEDGELVVTAAALDLDRGERGAVDRVLDAAVGADVERDVGRLVEEKRACCRLRRR